ncbi:MAG: electron transfer flavoprotein subunit beta/FixA family protein [Spirochaetales bacterium]|nr:electron transfer flavoprotein subunit beta/FixA family protein [Spirochaetales bacterium]
MKIIVCIKQVPDTTEVRLDPQTGTLIRQGVPSIINPDDKAGLEAALRLKDAYDDVEVTVLSMGPPQAQNALREAQAMGADRVILLSDGAFAGSDTWATSSALAGAIRKLDHDLIIAGRQAIDGDTAQVGPQIGEHLGIPSVAYVEEIRREEGSLVVKRAFEDGYHLVRVKLPCLITVLKEIHRPRYMRIGSIYDAWREEAVERWKLADIEVDPTHLGLKGSPTQVKSSTNKEVKGAGKKYDLPPREAARLIVDRLRERYVI